MVDKQNCGCSQCDQCEDPDTIKVTFTRDEFAEHRRGYEKALDAQGKLIRELRVQLKCAMAQVDAMARSVEMTRGNWHAAMECAKWHYHQLDNADLEAIARHAWPWIDSEREDDDE